MMKLGQMKTALGKKIVAVSITDDVIGIVALSFFIMFVTNRVVPYGDMFKLLLLTIGFYLVFLTVGTKIINRLLDFFGISINEQVFLSIPVIIAFSISIISEHIGLGFATGAFVAGMAMAKSHYTESVIVPKMKVISDGFFVPVFFALIGMMMALNEMNYILLALVLAAAVAGKVIGCGLSSRYLGYTKDEMKTVAISMIPRGDYNIVVAQIALVLGVINAEIFTTLISAVILTIVLTPVLLRIFAEKKK